MKISSNNPLVFLPGFGFKATVWQSITQDIISHAVLLQDLPVVSCEIASSSNPLDMIGECLSKQIPRQSTLIAWSFSGLLSLYLCYYFPNHYKQLILVNSTPKFLLDENWPGISIHFKNQFIKKYIINLPRG